MNDNEQILCLNKEKMVTLVRPGFGTISDAINGQLNIFTKKYPIIFQICSVGMATIFTIDDVIKLEVPNIDGERQSELIITLKGPQDYPTA